MTSPEEEPQSCRSSYHPSMAAVKVTLKNDALWKRFHGCGTEMIITKTGRRMFPSLCLEVSGLEPDARYFLLLEAVLSGHHRFKFNGGQWMAVGSAEPQLASSARIAIHPDSPATGATIMAQHVLFNRLKLTNNTMDPSGNLVLTSMHKYVPLIHVVRASDILALHWSPTATFSFPETEFTAVTAYQNDLITKLKIDNNPFAKGFRDGGHSRAKRKMNEMKEEDVEVEIDVESRATPVSTQDDSGISSIGSATPPILEDTQTPHATPSPQPPAECCAQLGRNWPINPFTSPYYHTTYWPYPPTPSYLLPPYYPFNLPPAHSLYLPITYPYHISEIQNEPQQLVDLSLRPTDYSLKQDLS